MPKYQNVDVDHPSIVSAIQNLSKQGKRKEEIMKVVGMPAEVIERVQRDSKLK